MRVCLIPVLLLISVASVAAQEVRPPLQFTGDKSLPKAILTGNYQAKVGVAGGVPPWKWEIIAGSLPPGLNLDPVKGTLTGVPTAPGLYRFAVEVSDSDDPPETRTREFTLTVTSALIVEWKSQPALNGDHIQGSLKLANETEDDADLTMIVVAVNEIGKAFVLGYQHFILGRESTQPEIAFGSGLPRGSYIVHADVIAEVPGKNSIYRSRLQTSEPLRVP